MVNSGGVSLPLGHGAVVVVDHCTGHTEYYEYGRYDDEHHGIVRRKPVPNLKMDKCGHPTKESLDALREYMSEHYGRGSKTNIKYDPDASAEAVRKYAKDFAENGERPDYDLLNNNCKTFRGNAMQAGRSR